MRTALEPRILILCPLAREWSFLVKTFESSLHVERLHDLKIDAAYMPDWRVVVAPGGHGKTQFAVHVIASGDEDVVTSKRAQEIRDQTGAACVAWEGSGAARAALFNGIGSLENPRRNRRRQQGSTPAVRR